MTTEAQIQANIENAKHSTGPRTLRGKENSKYNALKHGLLSHVVVLPGRENDESQEEYDDLVNSLRDDLRPCGAMQEYLVTKIAADMWILRRRYRAEAGAAKYTGNTAGRELRSRRQKEMQEALSRVMNPVRYTRDWQSDHDDIGNVTDVRAEGAAELRMWADGVQWILTFLEDLANLVKSSNEIPADDWQLLLGLYAHNTSPLGAWCRPQAVTPPKSPFDREMPSFARDRPSSRTLSAPQVHHLQALLKAEIKALETQLAGMKEEEDALTTTRSETGGLPDDAFLDRILRYEKTVSNDMYRALKELRALQKDQRPEPVSTDGEADTDDSDALRNW